jgi:hypothetical protein
MKAWIGVALVAAAQAFSAPAAIAATGTAPQSKAAVASNATDPGARRIHRRHPASPAYVPTYFARPYYYRPYPYDVPVPFFLGFGYLPYY